MRMPTPRRGWTCCVCVVCRRMWCMVCNTHDISPITNARQQESHRDRPTRSHAAEGTYARWHKPSPYKYFISKCNKKKSPKRKYVTFVHSRRSSALHTILARTAMRYELQLRSIDGGGEHARRTSPANRKCIKTIRKSSIQHPNAVHLNIVYSIRMLFERRAAEAMCDRMSPWREGEARSAWTT